MCITVRREHQLQPCRVLVLQAASTHQEVRWYRGYCGNHRLRRDGEGVRVSYATQGKVRAPAAGDQSQCDGRVFEEVQVVYTQTLLVGKDSSLDLLHASQ